MKMIKKITAALLILLAAALVGCSAPAVDAEPKTEDAEPKTEDELIVILHAGGGYEGLTHLNAQETFEYYYGMGFRYFEYDLRLSSDGRIIATHAWEHIDTEDPYGITYDEFKELRLDNGFTPANEEWLIETIKKHPDVCFVIDAKMDSTEGDSAVLKRLEELESVYNIDISKNIIPEIFSREMWDIVKEETSFDRYLFSHYKVYYTVDQMLEYFGDERIWGFALPTYTDNDIRSGLPEVKKTKKIFVFTPTSTEEVEDAVAMGADGVYLNFISLIE